MQTPKKTTRANGQEEQPPQDTQQAATQQTPRTRGRPRTVNRPDASIPTRTQPRKRKATVISEDEEEAPNEDECPVNDTMLQAIQNVMHAQMKELRTDLVARIEQLEAAPEKRRKVTIASPRNATPSNRYEDDEEEEQPTPSRQHRRNEQTPARATQTRTHSEAACRYPSGDEQESAQHRTADSTRTYGAYSGGSDGNEEDAQGNPQQVISELLAAAGSAFGRKRGKNNLLPHRYVIRGDKREKVGAGEATWPEYIAAICRMKRTSRPHGTGSTR